jgi:hypothetical protein
MQYVRVDDSYSVRGNACAVCVHSPIRAHFIGRNNTRVIILRSLVDFPKYKTYSSSSPRLRLRDLFCIHLATFLGSFCTTASFPRIFLNVFSSMSKMCSYYTLSRFIIFTFLGLFLLQRVSVHLFLLKHMRIKAIDWMSQLHL